MKLRVDIKEFGFNPFDVVALYWKRGKWRIYEQSSYPFRGKDFRKNLIKEVCNGKRVKPESVMIGAFPDFISLDVDILDIQKGKPKEIIYPKAIDKLPRK